MGQMWNVDPVPVHWVFDVKKLANGRQWRERRPIVWRLEVVVPDATWRKGTYLKNKSGTGHLEFSSLNAAVRGMQKFGELLDVCDVCEAPGTLDDPLADFYIGGFGTGLENAGMAHEECGKANGWKLVA